MYYVRYGNEKTIAPCSAENSQKRTQITNLFSVEKFKNDFYFSSVQMLIVTCFY